MAESFVYRTAGILTIVIGIFVSSQSKIIIDDYRGKPFQDSEYRIG